MKIEYKPLKDLVELVIDYRGKTPLKLGGEWSSSGYRALSALNVKTKEIVAEDKIRYVNEDLYKKWMKEEIIKGDILITSEAPFGQVFQWNSDEKIVLSQRLFALRIKNDYCSSYIFQYMASDLFYGELKARATGSTVEGLRQPALMKCKIAIPSLERQHRIASILSAYDNLIENNNKRIRLLEQLAENLYKEWFGRFRFPGHEKAEFESGLPKGWKIWSISKLCDINRKTLNSKNKGLEIEYLDTSSITCNQIVGTESYVFEEAPSRARRIVKHNSIVFSTVRPNLKHYGILKNIPDNLIVSTGFAVFDSKYDIANIIYLFLSSQEVVDYCQLIAEGAVATYPSIKPEEIGRLKIALPNIEIAEKWNGKLESLYSEILNLQKQNTLLSRQRDLLLPRLMSGKLEVNI
ncbi:restriction endonuclease subunit S [Prevotella sp. MA2016]|uniref:restriction endonuclease subunit S n=1 Tax=Prevotella sp. MA2016 TaxID=1408310 RepID=UPI00048E0502|nr:restriction endonuclease subunit S [Prevotella sp. MA2016]